MLAATTNDTPPSTNTLPLETYPTKKTARCQNAATSEPVAVVVAVVGVAAVVTEVAEVVVEPAPKTVASARRKTSLI